MRCVFLSAIVFFFVAGTAVADTILSCVNQRNGKLRIVGTAGQCTSKETPLSWNSEGPAGTDGAQGPPGEAVCGSARFELVGFTLDTIFADVGFLGLTSACQVDFPESRVCSTREIAETTAVPPGLSGFAWVIPVGGDNDPVFDGALSVRTCFSDGPFTSRNANNAGTVIDADSGSMTTRPCNVARPVACCAATQ